MSKHTLRRARQEFYGFSVNEYHWKRISFSRHFSQEAAENAHYTRFTIGEDPVSADLASTVIKGKIEFEKWAKECNYRIDWKNRMLIHKEVEPKHTPGPWSHGFVEGGWGVTPRIKVQNRCLLFVLESDGNILPSKEDARLIAAAPELLEALKESFQHLENIYGTNHERGEPYIFTLARKAIAKAEGEEK